MRAFLCSIDETVLDAVDVGWTRPKAAKSTWDKANFAVANANSKALNAFFFVVYLQMSFTGYLTLQLPRRRGKYWRPHMKAPRRWRTLSYRC